LAGGVTLVLGVVFGLLSTSLNPLLGVLVGLAGLVLLVATVVECRGSRPWQLGLALGLALGVAIWFGLAWINSSAPAIPYAEGTTTPGR
jgi:hypothetical protein